MISREPVTRDRLLGRATVLAPGTCGELVQGMVDDTFFHVTCPVNMYSTVTVTLWAAPIVATKHGNERPLPHPPPRYIGAPPSPSTERGQGVRSCVSGPDDCPKAVRAVELTLSHLGREGVSANLEVSSPLPRGKGMASSTADIVAAIEATASALGERLSAEEVARIALSVEPSDGTMFPGIAAFDHRHGRMSRVLGPPPPVDILALDFGGAVDTVAFNKVDRRPLLRQTEPQVWEALALARQATETGDPAILGRAASMSALANQSILPKPHLAVVMEAARAEGAVGVSVAHSGVVIGVLLDARRPTAEAVPRLLSRFAGSTPGLERHYLLKLVGGGAFGRRTRDSCRNE